MVQSFKKNTEVPGQFLGYSLQEQRVLARLLSSDPCAFVSLEVFDDVGVVFPGGDQLAEQGKSFHDSNPVSDRAKDLWKTFSNWIDGIESGRLNLEKTQFVIYTFQPHHGEIVDNFSSVHTREEARKAIVTARNKLWGSKPDFSLRDEVSASIEPYVTRFFTTDENIVSKLVINFSLECGSGNTSGDLKDLLRKSLIPEDVLDDTLIFSLGWVKEKIDSMIEQGISAVLSGEDFRNHVVAFVRHRDRRTILTSYSQNPKQEEITSTLRSLRTYIKQLELIECDDEEKIRAIIDFMRAEYDRTIWSVKGFVDECSFDEFEDGLIRTWDNVRRRIGIDLSGQDEIIQGKRIYIDCSSHKANLEGIEVPDHFTPGSFHALSDEIKIGWHPNYKNQLNKNNAKD